MQVPERIRLITGADHWCRGLYVCGLLVAALAIAAGPAAPAWKWLLGAALLAAFGRAWLCLAREHPRGVLCLERDGTARHSSAGRGEELLLQGDSSWVSRGICAVTLTDPRSGRSRHSLVCVSRNHPDDYRRLLQWLRLRHQGADRSALF